MRVKSYSKESNAYFMMDLTTCLTLSQVESQVYTSINIQHLACHRRSNFFHSSAKNINSKSYYTFDNSTLPYNHPPDELSSLLLLET